VLIDRAGRLLASATLMWVAAFALKATLDPVLVATVATAAAFYAGLTVLLGGVTIDQLRGVARSLRDDALRGALDLREPAEVARA
jgi:hypothetical protein